MSPPGRVPFPEMTVSFGLETGEGIASSPAAPDSVFRRRDNNLARLAVPAPVPTGLPVTKSSASSPVPASAPTAPGVG